VNPLPVIFRVRPKKGPEEDMQASGWHQRAAKEGGESAVIKGCGLSGRAETVNVKAFESPPPGEGFVTTMARLPAAARSDAVRRAVIWFALATVAGWVTPLTLTDEDGMNPVPVIVRVSGLEPASTDTGDKLVIVGGGFCEGGDWTAIVTVFDAMPPIARITGTELPVGAPAGTSKFTWYTPTVVGVNPENNMVAGTPPTVTVGVAVVNESGLRSAASPVAGWLVTGPRPVQKI